MYGLRSMRQTIQDVEVNVAYRWFLGYGLQVRIPHFSTSGKNYESRFKDSDLFETIFAKVLTRHVWEDYVEIAEDLRRTAEGKQLYQARGETIERVFADAKEKHEMRYTHYRGLRKVEHYLKLLFACMNLKKLALWKWKGRLPGSFSHYFISSLFRLSKLLRFVNVCNYAAIWL